MRIQLATIPMNALYAFSVYCYCFMNALILTLPEQKCSSFITVAVIKYPDKKQVRGGRHFPSYSESECQGRKLTGYIISTSKIRNKYMHASCLTFFLHSYTVQDPKPGNGTTIVDCAFSLQLVQLKRKFPISKPTSQFSLGNLSVRFAFKVILGYCS